MTSIFRQAFFNTSWGWQSSFGGWFSRTPSIPSWERFVWHSPVPTHTSIPSQIPTISLPKVETTSLRVWVDYQGNQFVNREKLIEKISAAIWNGDNTNVQDSMDGILKGFEDYIASEQKWEESSVRFNTEQLPTGITWEDLDIHVSNFAHHKPKETKVIIKIRGKDFELKTDFQDLWLYERKRGLISSEGFLFWFLSTGKIFEWEEWLTAPDSFRTAKLRLSKTLQRYFNIPGSPMVLQGNSYQTIFTLTSWRSVKDFFKEKDMADLYR